MKNLIILLLVAFTATFANAQSSYTFTPETEVSLAELTGEKYLDNGVWVYFEGSLQASIDYANKHGKKMWIAKTILLKECFATLIGKKYVKHSRNAKQNTDLMNYKVQQIKKGPMPIKHTDCCITYSDTATIVDTIVEVDTFVDFILIDTLLLLDNNDTLLGGGRLITVPQKKSLSTIEIEPVTIKNMDYSTKTNTLSYVPDSFYESYIKTYNKLLSHKDGSKRAKAKCKLKWLNHQLSLPKYCRKKFPAGKKVAKATYIKKKLTDFPSLLAPISRLNCRFKHG